MELFRKQGDAMLLRIRQSRKKLGLASASGPPPRRQATQAAERQHDEEEEEVEEEAAAGRSLCAVTCMPGSKHPSPHHPSKRKPAVQNVQEEQEATTLAAFYRLLDEWVHPLTTAQSLTSDQVRTLGALRVAIRETRVAVSRTEALRATHCRQLQEAARAERRSQLRCQCCQPSSQSDSEEQSQAHAETETDAVTQCE
eukprot:m.62310 g.62310  ORF g.62310 m.62310 type:complete len:198 (-) comp49542_c0_seq1:116-709(-)